MSRINVDQNTGIMYVHFTGFHDLEKARTFAPEMLAQAEQMRAQIGRVRLAVISEGEIFASTTEAVEEYGKLNAQLVQEPQDRFAYVVSSALVRLQFQRAASGDQFRAFETIEEAEAWLCD